MLRRSERSWWRRPLGGERADGVLASWSVAVRGGAERRLLRLPASLSCPQEPFCTGWNRWSGGCLDLYAPGHPRWDGEQSCYAANRTLFFDEPQEVFVSELPAETVEIELRFYRRDDEYRRRAWPPGAVRLRFADPGDRSLEAHIELLAGPGGEADSLRIASCRPGSVDAEALLLRLQSGRFRYCSIEAEESRR